MDLVNEYLPFDNRFLFSKYLCTYLSNNLMSTKTRHSLTRHSRVKQSGILQSFALNRKTNQNEEKSTETAVPIETLIPYEGHSLSVISIYFCLCSALWECRDCLCVRAWQNTFFGQSSKRVQFFMPAFLKPSSVATMFLDFCFIKQLSFILDLLSTRTVDRSLATVLKTRQFKKVSTSFIDFVTTTRPT